MGVCGWGWRTDNGNDNWGIKLVESLLVFALEQAIVNPTLPANCFLRAFGVCAYSLAQ